MTKPSDNSFAFEAVLIAATKDKNGYLVKLIIHPNDVPDAFVRDPVGSRYQFGACLLKDDGTPAPRKDVGVDAVKRAGILCTNPQFQAFMVTRHHGGGLTEQAARDALCTYCGITSRAELKTNRQAVFRFEVLMREYAAIDIA